jgi:hypothetical protein
LICISHSLRLIATLGVGLQRLVLWERRFLLGFPATHRTAGGNAQLLWRKSSVSVGGQMTQELIANMLGVRREGVTEAAGRSFVVVTPTCHDERSAAQLKPLS